MLLAVILAGSTPVLAGAEPASPPQRIRSVSLDPHEECPVAASDEIVICRSADEPYRIPKRLRHSAEIAAADQSWVNRAATMDEVSRVAAGLPNTCSPIGSGGQTGCTQALLRAWAAERRALAREAEMVP